MKTEPERSRVRFAAGWRRIHTRLDTIRESIRSRAEIDTRSLAALRIALGLILLIDLIHRSGYIGTFYTDSGVYPLIAYEVTYTQYTGLSLHAASGELWFQQFMFLVAGSFAVALVLGYRTRLVALVSLILLFSLHARNPAVLNGGDRLLRVLLLVALLTPLGERWSIDALRRGSARSTVASFATAALLVQPVAVFSSNAVQKHAGDTWYSGEAVQIALSNDVMTIFLGNHLTRVPVLLEVLNWTWVTLLSGSAIFLLLTTGRLRAIFALAYIGAFAGMLVSMALGLFPLVLTASVIPFLTAPFWDTTTRLLPSRRVDRRRVASRLGPIGRPTVERRMLSALRNRGYETTASFAVALARSSLTVLGALALVWILLFTASDVTALDVPEQLDNNLVHQQKWGLYAPNPSTSYSWYVVEAELENGTTVDAFGGSVDRDRPPDASQEYETFRHRKFMETVRDSGKDGTRDIVAESYADWSCDRANAIHDGGVERVTVQRFIQPSPIDGEYADTIERTVIERPCAPDR